MKIAIDLSQAVYGTGVSVYSKNLVGNLLKIDRKNDYILFGGSLRRIGELRSILNSFEGKNVSSRVFPLAQTLADFIWNKVHLLPVEKLIGDIDIFHSSDWTQPPAKAFKITTIHDLVPMKYPKLSHPKIVSTQKRRFKWVLKEADRVIVPSHTTAEDVKKMGIKPEKVRIISEAVSPDFKFTSEDQIKAVKNKFRITGKYLLSVGVNPRKNTERIIEAYEKIRGETNIRLVIIGNPYMKLEAPRGVYFLGHVSEEIKPALFSGAEALLYPSLYEGFGIPILEAFACKLPVVTSNIGSMKDVAGDAAVLVDPYNIESVAEGVFRTLKDKKKLIKMGLKRLKSFSWEKTARETLEVYSECVNQ